LRQAGICLILKKTGHGNGIRAFADKEFTI